jgi:hypothetical protein
MWRGWRRLVCSAGEAPGSRTQYFAIIRFRRNWLLVGQMAVERRCLLLVQREPSTSSTEILRAVPRTAMIAWRLPPCWYCSTQPKPERVLKPVVVSNTCCRRASGRFLPIDEFTLSEPTDAAPSTRFSRLSRVSTPASGLVLIQSLSAKYEFSAIVPASLGVSVFPMGIGLSPCRGQKRLVEPRVLKCFGEVQ